MPLDQRELTTAIHKLQEEKNKDRARVDTLFRESMIQYVVVFVMALAIDPIAKVLHLRFQPGVGWEQIAIMMYCLVQIVRLYVMRG